MAALYLTVVARCAGTDELVADTQLSGGGFKMGSQIPPTVEKMIGKFKTVVCLDAFHSDVTADTPLDRPFQKISEKKVVCSGEAARKLRRMNLSMAVPLVQMQIWNFDTAAGNHIHVNLDPLSWTDHLLVGVGLIGSGFFLPMAPSPVSSSSRTDFLGG